MLNNNEFYQNAMINIRKDNDEWKNAAETCSANLIEKSVTENGEYYAKDDNADGYSSVAVEVPSAPTPETFEVAISIPETESAEFRSTKTYSEIHEAIISGKKIIGSLTTISGVEVAIGSASLDTYTTFEKPEGEIVIPGILFSFLGMYLNDIGATHYMYLFMYHNDTNDRDIMKYSDSTYELPLDAICTQQIDN